MPRKRDRGPRFVRVRVADLPDAPPDVAFGGDDRGAVLMLEILGRILSLARRRLRLSQQDMAIALDWPQSVVSKVENGEVHLTVEQLDGWVTAIAREGEAAGDETTSELTCGEVYDLADAVAEALDEDGYEVRWGTGRLYEGRLALVRGGELEARILARWPENLPRLR